MGEDAGRADPLVVQAMRKAAVVWLSQLPGGRTAAVWCAWLDGALYVVSGAGEQAAPGLSAAGWCVVTGRGDNGARIVSWPAAVRAVPPGGEEWDRVVPRLAGKRLNLPADDDTAARWATDCVVSRLTPAGDPAPLPDTSLAERPTGSSAARRTEVPVRLGRVRRPEGTNRGRT